jgi:hypothetical protein
MKSPAIDKELHGLLPTPGNDRAKKLREEQKPLERVPTLPRTVKPGVAGGVEARQGYYLKKSSRPRTAA